MVVVGGGPAGNSAALQAARDGASVILLEREPQIATTVRTSGVTWMETVQEFGIPKAYYNPIKNYGFCSPNNEVLVGGSEYGAAVLDVRGTYRWLARMAQKAGVQVHTGTAVNSAKRDADGIIVSGTESSNTLPVRGKVVVDASGFPGVIVKSMGLAAPWGRFGVGAEYEMAVNNLDTETWWLMVGSMYSPAGYAWIFPIAGNRVRVGVGVAKPQRAEDPKHILDNMLSKGIGPVGRLGEMSVLEYHYGLIPNEGIGRKSVYDGVILVGDTAGQANPLVLEGIRYAIKFGRLAGKTAATAALSGDASSNTLSSYERAWRTKAESRIKSAYRVQDRWLGLTDSQWDRELDIIRDLSADQFLSFVKADFGLHGMMNLAIRHPKLAVRQLFGLLHNRS